MMPEGNERRRHDDARSGDSTAAKRDFERPLDIAQRVHAARAPRLTSLKLSSPLAGHLRRSLGRVVRVGIRQPAAVVARARWARPLPRFTSSMASNGLKAAETMDAMDRTVPMTTPDGYLSVAEGVSMEHPRPFGLLDCQCDPFLRSVSTKVVSCRPVPSTSKKAAPRWAVRLERMPLYPTCGGQTNDLGTIGGTPVLDVVRSGFDVDHIVERSFEPGDEVEVEVDWPRRMDHMCTVRRAAIRICLMGSTLATTC